MLEFYTVYTDGNGDEWEATFEAVYGVVGCRGVVSPNGYDGVDEYGHEKGELTSLQRNGESVLHKVHYFGEIIENLKEKAELNG